MIKRLSFLLLKIILITALLYGSYRAGDKGYRVYVEHAEKEQIRPEYVEFSKTCLTGKDSSNHSDILDALRHCVHMNSIHQIDEEYHATAKEGSFSFEKKVFKYSKGKLEKKPHLECSRRSILLTDLYRELGYKSRNILLVRKSNNFPGHIISEVLNPVTNSYEIQDPSYDVHYKFLETNKKLSINDAIRLSEESFVPCNISNNCSWALASPNDGSTVKNTKSYWDLAYTNWHDNKRGTLLYNSEKFSPSDILLDNGEKMSYCDKLPQHCEKKIDLAIEHDKK